MGFIVFLLLKDLIFMDYDVKQRVHDIYMLLERCLCHISLIVLANIFNAHT